MKNKDCKDCSLRIEYCVCDVEGLTVIDCDEEPQHSDRDNQWERTRERRMFAYLENKY